MFKKVDKGIMSRLGEQSHLIMHPNDTDRAIELLTAHIPTLTDDKINFHLRRIVVDEDNYLHALSSASEKTFYFGIGENQLLHEAGIKHLLGRSEGFAHVKTTERAIEEARKIRILPKPPFVATLAKSAQMLFSQFRM